MPANLENSAVATGLEKVSFHSNPKERQCQKCSNYCTIALISRTSKVMLKILQSRLQQYMNHEIPDVQAGFRKGRRTRDQIADICWILKKGSVVSDSVRPHGLPPTRLLRPWDFPGKSILEWGAIALSNANIRILNIVPESSQTNLIF